MPPAVLAELQDRNLPFVAKDETLVRQLGPGRRYDGFVLRRLPSVIANRLIATVTVNRPQKLNALPSQALW